MVGHFLIQGFFFQEHAFVDIAHRAESEGGVGVIFKEGLMAHMWSGVIFIDPDSGSLTGELTDDFGESVLSDIEIGPERITFSKRYHMRNDTVLYTFSKQDGYWVGKYEGEWVGKGMARCVLTELPEAFFVLED